jgi:hypothetical protein
MSTGTRDSGFGIRDAAVLLATDYWLLATDER